MSTILFTNARDEKHIKEWIAHHLNLGFDHIYIFDHKSILPIKSLFKPNSKLTINNVQGEGSIKDSLNLRAVQIAKKENFTWMLYLDADEFLVLNHHDSIQDFLNEYSSYNQIGINWVLFGSSFLSNDPDGMMIDSYIRCSSTINKHVKSIGEVSDIIGIHNPHAYKTKHPGKSIYCSTKLVITNEPWFCNVSKNIKYSDIPAYVAHYLYQSYSIYMKRRVNRMHDNGHMIKLKNIMTEAQLHNVENDIINTSISDKYSEKNKELIDIL